MRQLLVDLGDRGLRRQDLASAASLSDGVEMICATLGQVIVVGVLILLVGLILGYSGGIKYCDWMDRP